MKEGLQRNFFNDFYFNINNTFKKYLYNKRFELCLFFLIFTINAVYSLFLDTPTDANENGILANAAYLAGRFDWSSCYSSSLDFYWGYGYSLLYIPLFWIFNDIKTIYSFALLINAFFIACIPVLVYKLQFNYFNINNKKLIFTSSLCIGLFPAYFILSKYTWNETMLSLLPWIMIYVLLRLIYADKTYKTIFLSGVLGFLCSYAYSVHGRGLVMAASLFMSIMIACILRKKKIITISSFTAMLIISYLIDRKLKNIIIENLIKLEKSQARNTLESILSGSIFESLKIENIFKMFKGFMGQAYYIVVITFGLIILAFVILYIQFKKIRQYKVYKGSDFDFDFNKIIFGIYSIVLLISTIGMSTAFYTTSYITGAMKRKEYFIYGRYNEVVCALAILFVLQFYLSGNNLRKKYLIISLSIISFFLIWGTAITSIEIISKNDLVFSPIMISGILAFTGEGFLNQTQYYHFIILLIIVLIVILIFQILIKKNFLTQAMLLLSCIFLYSSTYYMINQLYPTEEEYKNRSEKYSEVFEPIYDVYVDYPNVYLSQMTIRSMSIQYELPDFNVEFLNTRSYGYKNFSKIKENSLIVSEIDEHFDIWLEDCYMLPQGYDDIYIWAYGSRIREELEQRDIDLISRDKLRIGPDKLFSSNGLQNEEMIVISNGELSYGPYINIVAGTYEITVTGKNLDIASFQVSRQLGGINIPIDKVLKQDSNSITFVITPSFLINDLEIYVVADSKDEANIDKMVIVESIEIKPLLKQNMSTVDDIVRGYTYLKVNEYQTGLNIKKTNECIQTQTMVLIRDTGYVYIPDISMIEGRYRLIYKGKNMDNAKVDFKSKTKENIVEILEYSASDEIMDVTVLVNSKVDDMEVLISNNENGFDVEFSELEIILLD